MAFQVPQGYAESYGRAKAATSPANYLRSFLSSLPNAEEKSLMAAENVFEETFQPLMDLTLNKFKDWGDVASIPNAGTSYMNWKNSLTPNQKRAARKNGTLNPLAFKQQYDAQVSMFLEPVLTKLESHRAMNNLNDSDMRKLLKDKPGLTTYLNQTLSPEIKAMHPYLTPKYTWEQWWNKKSETGIPFPGKDVSKAEFVVGGGLAGARAYGKVKSLTKSKEASQFAAKATKTNASKGAVTGIKSYIKKHGMSGLIKKVATKGGVKTAAKIFGRGALSLAGKASGVAAIPSLALDALTVAEIWRLISDIRK